MSEKFRTIACVCFTLIAFANALPDKASWHDLAFCGVFALLAIAWRPA